MVDLLCNVGPQSACNDSYGGLKLLLCFIFRFY